MYRTRSFSSPVVTLLSPSPLASRKAQKVLAALVGLEDVNISTSSNDKLNETFRSVLPGFSRTWDSVASKCPSSGTLVHFCSLDAGGEKSGSLSLVGLTATTTGSSPQESVEVFRDLLALHVKDQSTVLKMRDSIGGTISPSALLSSVSSGGLPLMQLPDGTAALQDVDINRSGLKEVVLPHFGYAMYNDGFTVLAKMTAANLARPTVGVYQWTGSQTHIRPLPTAAEDQRLPPPSLVFHHESPEEAQIDPELGVRIAKIGYGGHRIGQLLLLHPDLAGLDVRYCSKHEFSSSFSEAQDSLLAASLDELQSTNTLLALGEKPADDKRVGQSDCWVEVRANLKQPSGFWHRKGGKASKHRIAKIPDIPYE